MLKKNIINLKLNEFKSKIISIKKITINCFNINNLKKKLINKNYYKFEITSKFKQA